MDIPKIISTINSHVWGLPLIILLIGTGLFFLFKFRCIQLRGFKHAVDVIRGKYDREKDPGEISHFQALSTALACTIGTGNIVGVAAAILIGGPGAVFWMWLTAILGMGTKFVSCTLAVHFRKIDKTGETHGGPMHFIEMGMGKKFKWLAILFAIFTVLASFGIGNMFQINNIATSVNFLFRNGSEPLFSLQLITGIVVAITVGLVIIGGIKTIARFASILAPFMCLFFLTGGLFILAKNITLIPATFKTIFYYAFHTPEALTGGLFGTVIRSGITRGLFSNESGMGSAAIAHGAARTNEPVREGLVAMLGPFIDTLVVCSTTALVIIITGAHKVCNVSGELTGRAFEIGLGTTFGSKIIAISIILFAFSTLISWSYYGDRSMDYLFGKKAIIPYRYIHIGIIMLGACIKMETVINFCDAMNGLMAIPNLIAILTLSPLTWKLTKQYFEKYS